MSEIWEIAQYVEAHPDDHKQRWRLAKALYQNEEHRLALEHLRILKNEWIPKVNLFRYLAATYYRLGRYNEAISELEEAVKTWPEEAGLREQLARILEVAGRNHEAVEVWSGVQNLVPNHASAAEAVKRLNEEPKDNTPRPAVPDGQDSALMMPPGEPCPKCGAQNSPAFERCWKCRTPLVDTASNIAEPPPPPIKAVKAETEEYAMGWVVATAILALLLIGFGIFQAVWSISFAHEQTIKDEVFRNVGLSLHHDLLPSRLGVGLACVIAWPAVLWFTLWLFLRKDGFWLHTITVGLTLGSLGFVLAYIPSIGVVLGPVVAIIAAWILTILVFRLSFWRGTAVCAVHVSIMLLLALITFPLTEGFGPLLEAGSILSYRTSHDGAAEPGIFPQSSVKPPASMNVTWESTGSTWLDARARRIEIMVQNNSGAGPVTLELKRGDEVLIYQRPANNPFTVKTEIDPGQEYRVNISGPEGSDVTVTMYGMLKPLFQPI